MAPRLTIYPEFVRRPERWLHTSLRFRVMDRSDAEGLARDDPGSFWPEKVTAADTETAQVVAHMEHPHKPRRLVAALLGGLGRNKAG